MKKIFSHPNFKLVLIVVSYFVAAVFTYEGFFNLMPVITNYGRGLLTQLPTILIYFSPITLVSMLYLHEETFNVSVRWKIKLVTALSTITVVGFSLTLHIIFVCLGKYTFGLQTLLYPYDVIAAGTVLLAFGIVMLIHVIRTKELRNVPLTSTYHVGVPQKVATIAVISFGSYFLGNFYSVINIIGDYDSNWFGMIPFLNLYLLPTFALAISLITKVIKGIDKLKITIISGSIFLFLVVWAAISLIINPLIISESLSNFNLLGYCVKIPAGLIVFLVVFIVSFVYSLVKIIKLVKIKKYE